MSKAKTYLMLVLAAAFWGFQPSCIKWLMEQWSPVTVSAVRYFCFGVIIIFWCYYKTGKAAIPRAQHLPWLLLMGFSGVCVNNVFQFTGLKYTTITNCTLISSTTPCIMAMASFVVLKERLRLKSWVGIIISLVGALVIVSRGSWEVFSHLAFNYGDILAFGSQVAWVVYSLASLRVIPTFSPVATTGWAGFLGSFMTMGYGLMTNQFNVTALTPFSFGSLLYTIFLGGIFSMVSWNLSVKEVGASVAAIFLNIMPIVGMFAGWLLFNEVIGPAQLGGAAAIFFGVYLVTH